MPSPAERAATMLRSNRFMTLGTADADGPWVAPINYVLGPGPGLLFYSAVESRHSRALERDAAAAVSVFDSRASSEEVDGLQLAGSCRVVSGSELAQAHEHYFTVNFPDPEDREWWWRPVDAFAGSGAWRFYRLLPTEAYVIDHESMETERVDRRIAVDLDEMWHLMAATSTAAG